MNQAHHRHQPPRLNRNISGEIPNPPALRQQASEPLPMGDASHSAAHLVHPGRRHRHTFKMRVQSNGMIYEVLPLQYQKQLKINSLYVVSWAGIIITIIGMIIVDELKLPPIKTNLQPIWLTGLVGLDLTAIVHLLILFHYRKLVSKLHVLTTINIISYITIVIFLISFTSVPIWIPTAVQCGIQCVISIFLFKAKRLILTPLVISFTPIFAILKRDGIIEKAASWEFVMVLPYTLVFAMIFVAFLWLYGSVQMYKNGGRVEIVAGLVNRFSNFFLGAFILTCFVIRFLWTEHMAFLGVPTILVILAYFKFLAYPYHIQLALFACDAAPSQNLQYLLSYRFNKNEQETTFFKISSTYYSFEAPQNQRPLEEEHEEPQCAICLSEPPTMCWMPCGHLCTCWTCGKYLMKNKSAECVMCKTPVTRIYHITHIQQGQSGLERNEKIGREVTSDYFYQLQK